MALTVELYSHPESMYRPYMRANFGNMVHKDPGIFTLPSWLCNYWFYKGKIRIKGCQKISLTFSEFEERTTMMPSKRLGAILHYNCHFDFEELRSLDNLKGQQLYVLDEILRALLTISDSLGWEKDRLEKAYQQAREDITTDTIPENFWNIIFF